MHRRLLWLAPALLGGTVLVACGSESLGHTERVFVAPAWTGAEQFEYELSDPDLHGYCTHTTEPGDDGTATLTTACIDAKGEGYHDDTTAVVDSQTLEPHQTSRTIVNIGDGTQTYREATYDPPDKVDISLLQTELDDPSKVKRQYDTTRDLPVADKDSPDPGWYDESSLFWLVRGIPLEEGFKGRFANVNISTVQLVGVEIEVEGKEEVEVPAGTFMAWNIRVKSSVTNRFWVEVDAPHRVVKARLEETTFELTSSE